MTLHRRRSGGRKARFGTNYYFENKGKYDHNNFRCCNCKAVMGSNEIMGTAHRNHCSLCLWSLHVDTKPGNRASTCHGMMEPVALTFKWQSPDKYGQRRIGDLMIVHMCFSCGEININRIAGDDCSKTLIEVFERSKKLSGNLRKRIEASAIKLLNEEDEADIYQCLFGKLI